MTEAGEEQPSGALIEISLPIAGELVEPVWELFERHGGGAVLETRVRGPLDGHAGAPETWLRTYLPVGDAEARLRIELGLWHLGQIMALPEATIRTLAEANWAEAWKAHYVAQRVGPFLVTPTWLEPPQDEGLVVLRLDPGMAFGTGQHPTTRLCLAALEGRAGPATRVLDVGTGSGILAIGAALLGAQRPVALDIDPRAVETALANAAVSGVAIDGRATTLPELLAEGSCGPFDLVLANLLAGIVTGLADDLANATRPGGTLIASGILDEQAAAVAEALTAAGFAQPEVRIEGDWVALIAMRATDGA